MLRAVYFGMSLNEEVAVTHLLSGISMTNSQFTSQLVARYLKFEKLDFSKKGGYLRFNVAHYRAVRPLAFACHFGTLSRRLMISV